MYEDLVEAKQSIAAAMNLLQPKWDAVLPAPRVQTFIATTEHFNLTVTMEDNWTAYVYVDHFTAADIETRLFHGIIEIARYRTLQKLGGPSDILKTQVDKATVAVIIAAQILECLTGIKELAE